MAKDSGNPLRLGVFLFLGAVLIIVGVFLIGKRGLLFGNTYEVKAVFSDVQGLRNGALVRLSGIDVGSVSDINILPDSTGKVEVTMKLGTDLKRFIRTDSRATIETEGLVGNKVVVLHSGSQNMGEVPDGGYIQTKEPLSYAAIIQETQGVMEYTKNMTKSMSQIAERINNGEGSLGKLLTDERLYNNAAELTRQADVSLKGITRELKQVTDIFDRLGVGVENVVTNVNGAVNNVNSAVTKIDTIVAGVERGRGMLGQVLVNGSKYDSTFAATMQNIQTTSEAARLAASRLAENMEALKHNWLFKSYFENRGYWDKAEYEDEINKSITELNEKIKLIDAKIEELKKLEKNGR